MKPKEKAIELYNKFRNENSVMTSNIMAKKQALICVDEILTLGWNLPHYENMTGEEYWKLVAIELNKLTKTTP